MKSPLFELCIRYALSVPYNDENRADDFANTTEIFKLLTNDDFVGENEPICPTRPRWWFGGVSSSIVACVVAPFDLVKSHMQTQRKKKNIWNTALKVYNIRGIRGFYDGFSAALLRQMTCTSVRFSVYEFGKSKALTDTFLKKMLLASCAGCMGAVIGIPTDLINVRMQTDMKSPPEFRRNYKNVFDALVRIPREEGFFALYNGSTAAVMKSALGTIGQIAVYDQVKELLQRHRRMADDMRLHFMSSMISSIISSIISQPLDVLKTLQMNSRPGEFENIFETFKYMTRFGPIGLFRGLLPTIARKGPSTVLLFLIYEQLRLHFGIPTELEVNNGQACT